MNRRQLQPYPGLRPFERDESKIFFGRQKQVNELLQRLKDEKFLAVLGASGSGKSSLVRAGLLPGLDKGYMGELGAKWKIVELRPGDQPFERLAEELGGLRGVSGSDSSTFLTAQLRRGARSLNTLLEQSPLDNGEKLLILVDQFEEIFRYRQQAGNQAAAFVALLLEACTHRDVFVVITMRSDFLGDAAAFYGLPEAINDGLYLTPRLTREQLREAIALPAKLFGGVVEDALANRLLNEAGNDPDQLPLLQHALMRLWGMAEDQRLTLPAYQAMDGLHGALDRHLERVFGALKPKQQAIAEVMFRLLTTQGEDGQAIRRPALVQEVLEVAHCELAELEPVVDAFRGVGRHFLMTSTPALTAQTVLDISHESLIRQWGQLHKWVGHEADKVTVYQRLLEAAQRHQDDKGGLWHGTDLALGLDWRRVTAPDAVWAQRYSPEDDKAFALALGFLNESEAAEQQQRHAEEVQRQQESERQQAEIKRSRRQLMFAVVGLMIAAGLAIWAALERTRAEQQTEIATEAATRAEHQKAFAEEQKQAAQQAAERADAESERAKASEDIRTRELFDSDTTHASLLAQMEDYAAARKKLAKTHNLNDDVPVERTHARDLLAGFVEIMGGKAERTLTDEDGKPLPQLNGNVALSPDGQWLAASGERGTIALFDRASERLVQKLVGHNAIGRSSETTVRDIVFHPEQPWLFSAGDDGQIIWWQLPKNGDEAVILEQWSVDAGKAWALALTADGEVLASGHDDGGIQLWEVKKSKAKGTPYKTFKVDSSISYHGLDFTSDGKKLLVSNGKQVSMWDWENQKRLHSDNRFQALTIRAQKNSNLFATASENSIYLWQIFDETFYPIKIFKGHANTAWGLEFINSQLLASASGDNTVRLWDVETGVTRRVLQGHTAGVTGLALYKGSGQSWLYSNSNDGTVKQWRADLPGQWLVDLPSEPTATVISPNGKFTVIGFNDGSLRVYALGEKPEMLQEYNEAYDDRLIRLSFNSDGTKLAAGDSRGSAKVWSVAENGELELLQSFDNHTNIIHAVAFSPDNTQLATASYDGNIGLFDLESGEGELVEAHVGGQSGGVESISFSPDGKHLLSAGYYDLALKLWDLTTQPPTAKTLATANDALLWATLSPNGNHLASVGRDHTVTIYPTQNQQPPLRLHGHEQAVFKAIFSPDSRQLATVGGDMTVRLWDLDTESELFRLRLPENPLNDGPWDFDFRCTPTGCWIAVPLTSGKLALYNLGKINY